MPRTEIVLRVLVASPSDLRDERLLLEDVVRELNTAWSSLLGIRLELVRWESDAYSAIDEDAQAVINAQLPTDYDIFLGLMWARFGTPTGRAGSGTEEEFIRALARHQASDDEVEIMFYFKDAPIAPSEIDPQQLAAVAKFRAEVNQAGVLSWKFKEMDEFASLARVHLAKQIQSFLQRRPRSQEAQTSAPEDATKTSDAVAAADLGYFDALEVMEDSFDALTEIGKHITEILEDLTARISQRTLEINQAKAGGIVAPKTGKRLANRAADDLDHFALRLRTELPAFSANLQTGMAALGTGVALSGDFGDDPESIRDALTATTELLKTMDQTAQSIRELRDTIASSPRLTVSFNRAKRSARDSLEELASEISQGRHLILEALNVLQDLLSRSAKIDLGDNEDSGFISRP